MNQGAGILVQQDHEMNVEIQKSPHAVNDTLGIIVFVIIVLIFLAGIRYDYFYMKENKFNKLKVVLLVKSFALSLLCVIIVFGYVYVRHGW